MNDLEFRNMRPDLGIQRRKCPEIRPRSAGKAVDIANVRSRVLINSEMFKKLLSKKLQHAKMQLCLSISATLFYHTAQLAAPAMTCSLYFALGMYMIVTVLR
jgi:hypothetical protein